MPSLTLSRSRRSLVCAAAFGAIAAASCTGSPETPAPVGALEPAASGSDLGLDPSHFVLGRARLELDPQTLTASLSEYRQSQHGELFYLPINAFFGGGPVFDPELEIGINGDGDITITYRVTHPFDAPASMTAPPTAVNRADLGITGRTFFLVGIPAGLQGDPDQPLYDGDYHMDFNGDLTPEVRANPFVIVNADGYLNPGDLAGDVSALGGANNFPFLALVDESLDPRSARDGTAIPNSFGTTSPDGRGNFNPGAGGWQASNIGTNRNGWTGFGFLHQGQRAENTAVFSQNITGPVALDLVVVASYTDPKGVPTAPERPRDHRLPNAANDSDWFSYFAAANAVDLEDFSIAPGTQIADGTGQVTPIDLSFVDQDMSEAVGTTFDTIPQSSGVGSWAVASSELGFLVSGSGDPPGLAGTGPWDDPATYTVSVTNVNGTTGGLDGMVMVGTCLRDEDVATPPLSLEVPANLVPIPETGVGMTPRNYQFFLLPTVFVPPPTWTQIHTMIVNGDPAVGSTSNCVQCHAVGAGGLFMDANPATTYGNLVNIASFCPPLDRIEPNDPNSSHLYRKILGTQTCGVRMPENGQYWSAAAIQMVAEWINDGAPNN